ncbi:MAG: amidohydrolase family protein [Bacteroidota bacterium]
MIRRAAAQTLAVSDDKLTAAEKKQLTGLGVSPKYISPIPLLDYLGALKNFIAIHSVWTLHDDISIFNKEGNKVHVSHNPESNMYLSSGIAPVLDYLNADVPVTLGTDGAASNDGIDFFSAMRAFWNLQKIKHLNSSAIKQLDEWDVIKAATLYGAEALGIAHKTGSITKGKEADLFLLSENSLGMSPITHKNVLPLIIYSASPRDVEYVISNGKIVVEKGALTQFDEHHLAAGLSAASQKAHERVNQGKTIALSLRHSNVRDTLKYFSVRLKDSIHIVMENDLRSRKKVNVQLLFSGTTFGGTVPSLMAPESRVRFPHDDPPDFWKLERRLRRKEKITLTKAKQSLDYNITLPNGKTIIRKGVSREQLLLMFED